MSKRESISRYNFIIKRLRRHPSTFEEVADYLAYESEIQGYDYNISKRTFHRDKADILSLYNIEILYDSTKKVYYIGEENSEMNHRILEAFDIFNALNLSDRLSEYIHFETRKPIGTENLHAILDAVKNSVEIQFTYQKFYEEEADTRVVRPYALKESKHRWYLLAEENEIIKIFSLDRLSDLTTTRQRFTPNKDFDINSYFEHSFGIIQSYKKEPKKIVLSFKPIQGKYVKTLPLHPSQKVLIDNSEELQIELSLFPTKDFLMELLSHGKDVKVIKPKSIEEDIKKILKDALQQYKD